MKRLLLAIAASTLLAPYGAGAAPLPAGFIGISPQGITSAADYRLMGEAGIQSVRLPLIWAQAYSRGPSTSGAEWSWFDREVRLAAESGMRIMPVLYGSPKWAAPELRTVPVRSAWQRWAWASFLRGAVARYGPRGEFWRENADLPRLPVRYWEIWNEPNIVSFASKPNPTRFAALIRLSGRVLHRADRGSKVILGGLFGRPLQVPPNVASGDFLARLYRARPIKPFFDGVALHPYVARAQAMVGQIRNLRRVMRAHRDAATPLYVTELGWGSQSGPSRWERGLRGQARQLSISLSILSAQRLRWRIGGVWWYTWADYPDTCIFCDTAGLLTAGREAKPSWYVFNAWTGGDSNIVPRAHLDGG